MLAHLSQNHFSPSSPSDIDKNKNASNHLRSYWRFYFYGGLLDSYYEHFLPKAQVIDSINLKTQKIELEEIFLKKKYVEEGFSSAEIAKLSFSSRPTITKILKRHNIPLKIYTRRNNGGHVYGYRKFGGKAIEMKKEQEVIKLIKSYRESGYSYQKIADILNHMKIETKNKKGFWYSKVIRQVSLRT